MKKKERVSFLFALMAGVIVIGLSLSPSPGNAALQAVSPDNAIAGSPHIGYPLWYRDFTGLSLKPCIDPVGLPGVCVGVPAPGATADQPEFEDFFWIMEASGAGGAPLPSGAFYRAALEMATFANPLLPGGIERTLFFRVRIRFNTTLPGDYTVTHPFGVHVFRNVGVGIRAINDTIDLGLVPNNFTDVLTAFGSILDIDEGRVPAAILLGSANAFPAWSAALPAPPAGYIGNFGVAHAVTDVGAGAVFSITGPGTNISTDQFFLAGQIFAAANRPPVVTMDNNVFPPITAGAAGTVVRTATYSDPDNNALSVFTATLTPTPADNTWFTATRLDNTITITINQALIPAADNNKAFTIDMHATDTGIPPLLGHNHPTFTVGTVAAPAVAGAGGGGGGGCAIVGGSRTWRDGLGAFGMLMLVGIGLRLRKRKVKR